jgi:hypothetical protein
MNITPSPRMNPEAQTAVLLFLVAPVTRIPLNDRFHPA